MTKKLNLLKQTAAQLNSSGQQLREQDRHDEAVLHLSLAIVYSQKEGDYEELVESLGGRMLAWKHFYLLTGDTAFAVLAKKDAEAALEIAVDKNLKNKLSKRYFNLGEVCMLFEDYESAISNYENSLELYVGSQAEKGDFRYHLGEALYRNGDKAKGKATMYQGLEEIQENAAEVDAFLIHVWESGCHMRLAELLRDTEPKTSREHFLEAVKIINKDERLVIRKRQLEVLKKALSY